MCRIIKFIKILYLLLKVNVVYCLEKKCTMEEHMGKRNDIHKVLIIGSGPIIIGQACEFDYSGTQACKALRQLGYEIVLVNSNPATIMTDPGIKCRTP